MKLTVDFILITGVLLNILTILGLVRIQQKKLPHYILIIFWVLILGVFAYFYASLHELQTLKFIANYLEDGVRFFIPPLIFLYVKSIFIKDVNLVKKNLIHFVPFMIYFLIYTLPKSFYSGLEHIQFIDRHIDWALVQDLFGITYFLMSLWLFYRVKRTMKDNYSNITDKDFLWIEKFLISFLIVLIVDLILTISEISFGYNVTWDGYITVIFIIIAMSYLGYYGLMQSTIFLPDFLIQKNLLVDGEFENKSRYIKEEEKEALRKRFHKCMNEEKIFLSPDLNLKTIADKMDISDRKLSAFFAEVLNSNFYDTINSYRVEEAKIILKSDVVKSHSITGIGLSCGFSSKSSFYRIFKKKTNLSPSAYRNLVLKESHSTQ
ncbi:AraC family transcriptional regulator [Winogradskyella sp.]|uniref:helix-turn-helix domain-containing protein n=1 Tax=Winogradskyella sp. TaxID=1883156 RepID=UPI002619AA61|nr:helix-turn-helix domain-containing protein [Winogradskyella sp.]